MVITDNKKFLSAVKTLFSDQSKAINTVVLYEKRKIIKNYKKVLQTWQNILNLKNVHRERAFWIHLQRKSTKATISKNKIRETEKLEIIKSLPKNKATVFKDIPMRIIKNAAHVYSHRLKIIFNNCIRNRKFPDILKYADMTPVFKKGETNDKSNYRRISTLSNFSEIFEKLIYSQVNSYIEPKLSKYLAGFRGNHNTQHALLRMTVSWRV